MPIGDYSALIKEMPLSPQEGLGGRIQSLLLTGEAKGATAQGFFG